MWALNKNIKQPLFLVLTMFCVVGVDRVTKWYAKQKEWGQLNTGGIWGWLDRVNWPILSLVILFFLGISIQKTKDEVEKIGLIIIWCAGLSNLLDRFWYGGVWDWIYYPGGVVGNLADIFLGVGVTVVIGRWLSKRFIG